MKEILEKKGFICDMDGVIYHGNNLLSGAADFIRMLDETGKKYLFLTNSSERTPRELAEKLARLGVRVEPEHFYTSALATIAILRRASLCLTLMSFKSVLLRYGLSLKEDFRARVRLPLSFLTRCATLSQVYGMIWQSAR